MKQSDLLRQWKQRSAARTDRPAPLDRRPPEVPAYPSAGQRRLFLLQQLHPGNPFYQYAHRYEITGPLDAGRLEESFRWVMERQDALRSNIRLAEDSREPELTYQPAAAFALERVDLSATPSADLPNVLAQREQTFARRPFDLERDLLVRGLLIRTGAESHRLIIGLHHIIGDRGSLLVLEQALWQHYTQLTAGTDEPVPAPTVRFEDYAYHEATRTVAPAHYDYWREELSGDLPDGQLPYDHPRPAVATHRGRLLEAAIDPELSATIRTLARDKGTTPNVIFLAVFAAFLRRYGGPEDTLIGLPVSTRDRTELENLVGFLNETVVLRTAVTADRSLEALIGEVKTKMENALKYKDVSFDWLVKALNPGRQQGVNPFFQTMFVYNGLAPERVLPDGLHVTDAYVDLETAKFDLTLFASDLGTAGFRVGFEYARDLFAESTVAAMLRHFTVFLRSTVSEPAAAVSTQPLLDEATQRLLLHDWNPTLSAPASAPLVLDLLDRVPAENLAVSDGEHRLTYGELEARAEYLTHLLLDAGLQAGEAVGLYCGRGPELLVGIVGILRAGGAYLPLDPEYPSERIAFIGADAGAKLLVKEQGRDAAALPPQLVTIDIPTSAAPTIRPLPTVDPQQNAYLIYTSGSTGLPKGIPITHANLAHSTAARRTFYDEQPGVFLLLSSFAFDSSVAGIFWSLVSGGKLVLSARRAEQDPAALSCLIAAEGVTHTLMLPSLYQLLLEFADPGSLDALRVVMVAGEACPPVLVKRHFRQLPDVALVNEYGPTENTVWSTAHRIQPTDAGGRVPIGQPIDGVGHYVLDAQRQLVPPGVAGELYLSGPGLTAGYHGRPDLTAAVFSPNPFPTPHDRLYATGDLVRYRKNKLLDFLGRRDHQVKIRGHRIEPDEISNVLAALPGVTHTEVRVLERDGAPLLVGYYTAPTPLAPAQLTADLKASLPDYMVPTALVHLTDFPRLPNGKTDLKKLPPPPTDTAPTAEDFVAPETELERQVAALWESVLQYEPVGRHDNFFDVGGDSLKSIRFIGLARKQGLFVAPQQIFRHQTVAELAAAIAPSNAAATDAADQASAYEALVLLRKGRPDLAPLFCVHSGGGHVFFYQPLARALAEGRSVYAIQPPGLLGEQLVQDSIEKMAADYLAAVRRVQPTGPYHLLGTCFSNAVALEMAEQLREAGQTVERLFIIDSGTGNFLKPGRELVGKPPARNLVTLLQRGDLAGIRRKISNRVILAYRAAVIRFGGEKKDLYGTIGALNRIYNDYEWPHYPGRVTLIRSSEFAGRADKDNHVDRWQKLVGEVEVHVVPGHHLQLFQPPEVTGLAQKIDACLR